MRCAAEQEQVGSRENVANSFFFFCDYEAKNTIRLQNRRKSGVLSGGNPESNPDEMKGESFFV